jgi:hypothetical protein
VLELYEKLKALILSAEEDIKKSAGGNKAAGTRVRKSMQDIKNTAHALRIKVLEKREDDAQASPPAGDQDGPSKL